MNRIGQTLIADEPNPAADFVTAPAVRTAPGLGAIKSLRAHWPEYLMEAALLGSFMVSACVFGTLYEFPGSPVRQAISSPFLRRILMGISMGLTAIGIIYSPWGKQSGAHINPSATFTFYRLGKIKSWDAIFYIAAQFTGAALGVLLVAQALSMEVSHPAVRYVATVPGSHGALIAFIAEFLITAILFSVVLYATNHDHLARYTGLFVGGLVATYITLEAPFSGMSMNPARTFGSALGGNIWTNFWIYLTAPPLGMLTAAELYLWRRGRAAVMCCKFHHDNDKRCIFCGKNGGFEI